MPRFRQVYEIEHVPGTGTFLLTETGPTVLNGRLNESVCQLIDGHRTVDDIARALLETVSPAETYYTLEVLSQRGFIEEARSDIAPAETAFWQTIGVEPELARHRLQANPVQVLEFGSAPSDAFREALSSAGVLEHAEAALKIAVVDDYRDPNLEALDQLSLETGAAWGILKPVGTIVWVGPFFVPPSTGCYGCLVDRLRMNLPVESFLEERRAPRGPLRPSRAALGSTVAAACHLAATEVAKWIVRDRESELNGAVMTINTLHLRTEYHKLTRRPQCRRCGLPEYRSGATSKLKPVPLRLHSRKRVETVQDAHRTRTAEEMLGLYESQISPITGIVSHLERVSPKEDTVIHAYAASHNWSTHPDSLAFLKRSLRSRSGGKGHSDVQARAGAVAEAFERYSGVYRGDEIRMRKSYNEMGPGAIHPDACMLFSKTQYERREEINRQGNAFQMVPFPFIEDAPTDWSPLWSPTSGDFFWLPTGYLYYSYSKSLPASDPNRLAFYADSNGCAAGNTLEEAALQAMLELAERDAVATWWYSRVRRPAVNLCEIDDPFLEKMWIYLAKAQRELWVLDISNDIGIPVFAAVSSLMEPLQGSEQVVVGFGAHLDPKIGILRAITEVNQFFASLQALDDKDLAKAFDPGAVDWWRTSTRENRPYLLPDGCNRSLATYPDLTSDDLLEEVNSTIQLIERRGLRVLLLDQTRPDLNFPVVKAVAPGMRHFWARLAPGRLYDVPLKLGWIERPLRETELNPVPVFF